MSDPGLLGPAEIRELAARLGIQPTKRLGQNFVIDPNTVRRIVRLAGVQAGETVVEVGPGLGSLTLGLLGAGAAVVAVEIDGRLAAELPTTVAAAAGAESAARLTVLGEDALRVTELPDPVRLVANLPYNVSVPVLLHFLATFPTIRSGVVMVQAEVGERIAAGPGSKAFGVPSLKAAWYGDFKVAARVGRSVFWPVPNVDSVLVAFERSESVPGDEALRLRTFGLIDGAFQQRRKMLRSALSARLGSSERVAELLEKAGLPATSRGEELRIADFVRLARIDAEAGGAPAAEPEQPVR